ncbi:hypothetical protein AB6C46_08815 [Vibrio sp. 10N.237.312.C02]|uniref:hypothetical protein n=1 Tax=unclassified Vibrio TaxID=2614977 RepID=UPI00352EA85C
MTEQPKNTSSKALSPGLSIGGASTAFIAMYNAWGNPENAVFVSTAVPVVVGALFWLLEYAFTAIGVRSLEELKVIRRFDGDIKKLNKSIVAAKKLGYPQEEIDILMKQHIKLVVARSEISSNPNLIKPEQASS